MPRLIISANGILPELESAHRLIQAGDVLIAADGGTRHVLALGLVPSMVIGDLDSLTQDDRTRALVGRLSSCYHNDPDSRAEIVRHIITASMKSRTPQNVSS